MSPAAFLDANVLYPAALRGVLMELALAGAFRPMWSGRVHDEWTVALARDRPDLAPDKIARVRALMVAQIEDAMVHGYEPLIGMLTLPDPGDRHVLTAAIHGGASVIVTANLRDFPRTALTPHNIAAMTPDDFLVMLIASDPDTVIAALAADRASLKNPPTSTKDYLVALERAGLAELTHILRAMEAEI